MLSPFRLESWTPLHVQIEVTWRCNWRCVHCYQDDHTVETLSLERLQRLFGECASLGTLHLIVTGGEPLVRKDIMQVLRAARGFGLGLTLYTNGHRVTPQVADEIAEHVAAVEISILAGEAAIHDRLSSVPGSCEKAWRAVDLLLERGVSVMVKTPLLSPALPTLARLEAEAQRRGIDWNVDPSIAITYAGSTKPLQYQCGDDELVGFFKQFPRFNPVNGFSADPGVKHGMCLAGRAHCFIDANGNVYPCLSFKSAADASRERSGASPRLGSILTQSLGEIWESADVLRSIRSLELENFATCSGCSAGARCRPCMALNYETHGELTRPSPVVCGFTSMTIRMTDPHFTPASERRVGLPVLPARAV